MLGGGQGGTAGGDYEYVSGSPGIDVLSDPGPALIGSDQWNGLGVRFQQAAVLDKPIIEGRWDGGRAGARMHVALEAYRRGHKPREGAAVSRDIS